MARVRDIYGSTMKASGFSQKPRTTYDAFVHPRKLELIIRCTDLCQIDTFSKSDPMCVLFLKNMGQWCEYARTESIPNNLNPRVCLNRILNSFKIYHKSIIPQ